MSDIDACDWQSDLRIDDQFVRHLPADPVVENSCRQVHNACYSFVTPLQVPSPVLVSASPEVAELIGVRAEALNTDEFTRVFVGNQQLDSMRPFACCYGGHQFGNWAGQLGDGRAINLGEAVNTKGEHWALQLKGAGPTPYSRTADGLAVLRSSVREFLCSEAMHYLGVPTTRALSLILTGNRVERDMLYDGNPAMEPGAVVCRVAKSFTRFGNFEIFASRGDLKTLRSLIDYTIEFEFPHILASLKQNPKQAYLTWFAEVADSTVDLVVHWMRVGFVHGVMNTDNLSIHGLTIDYGPYGWLDNFDPSWTPNTTDAQNRRYRYSNQPSIAQWNLLQLANAIYPLIESSAELEAILNQFQVDYQSRFQQMMANKLGLQDIPSGFGELCNDLFNLLYECELDMTLFYRGLVKLRGGVEYDYSREELLDHIILSSYNHECLHDGCSESAVAWLRRYLQVVSADSASEQERSELMNASNPKFILRNYLTQQATDKAQGGDFSMVNDLLDTMREPYAEQPQREAFAAKRPDWARNKPGCSMLSCSS